jgi:hypothetical protein
MLDFLKRLRIRLSFNVRPLSLNEVNLKNLLKSYGFSFKKIKYYYVVRADEVIKISEFTFTNIESIYTLKIKGNLNEFIDYYNDRNNNLFIDIVKFQTHQLF